MLRTTFEPAIPNAQHLDPSLLPPGAFTGLEPPEEVQKFRSRVINALRQRQLYKYLEQSVDSLLPDPEKYGDSHAERRKLDEDTERKRAEAGQAYALVKALFKPGSAADAIIRESETFQDLPQLWTLFTNQYLRCTTVQDAMSKMKEFMEKPTKLDNTITLVGAFLSLQDLIYDFEIIDPATTFIPSATGINTRANDYATPRQRGFSPQNRPNLSHTQSSADHYPNPPTPGIQRRNESTKFPEYIWVMQVLLMIQTVPHLQSSMQKFFREKIYNNRHMTVGRLRADGILNLLREFEKQETISSQTFQKGVNFADTRSYNTLSSRDREIAEIAVNKVLSTMDKASVESHYTKEYPKRPKTDFFCQNHGYNGSHNTSECRRANMTYGYGNGRFFNNNKSPLRSPGEDIKRNRSPSFDKYSSSRYPTRERSRSRDYDSRHSRYDYSSRSPARQPVQNSSSRSPSSYSNRNQTTNPALARLRALATTTATSNTDDNGHPYLDIPDFEVNMVRIQCSLTEGVKENTILADNGASHTIINEDWASLVQDFKPMDGSVSGSTQGTLGRVVGEGFINFFGDRLHVYVANITTSVLSIGQTCSPPHQMEWRIMGNNCQIINHRTGEIFYIFRSQNNLYPIPAKYFDTPPSSLALTERIITLRRTEKEEDDNLRARQMAEMLRFQRASSFEELDRRYDNHEQLKIELDEARTYDEVERAHRRYNDRETLYLTELGLPRWKEEETKKERRYIEDDDKIPELRSDDDDSDDEDNNTAKHSHWRLTHNDAARATASTNPLTLSQSQATSSQANPESSKRARESTNYQTHINARTQPALYSANTLHTEDTQKTSGLQNPITKPTAISERTQVSIQNLWHQRLGHPNNRRLRDMANNPLYLSRGFPALTSKQLDMRQVCDACMTGKSHTITSHKSIDKDATKKGQSWSVDLTGRKDTAAIGDGAHIGVVFIEHSTRFSVTYTIQNNDEDSILDVLKRWNDEHLSLAKSWHKEDPTLVYFLHSDNLEMTYKKSQRYLTSIGVKSKLTDPDHSSSNGLAERLIGTLDRTQRVLRLEKSLPDEFWGTAFTHANYLRIRMPYTYMGRTMPDPHTAYYGHTHDYANLRIFGSTCWVHARDAPKSAPHRAYQGIFIGYRPNSNTPSVFVPSLYRIIHSGDVKFDEQRQESLQPSFSTSEFSSNAPTTSHLPTKTSATSPQPLSELNDEDFVNVASKNIQDFHCGSETRAI